MAHDRWIATAASLRAGTVALGAAAHATTAPDGDKGVIAFSYGNESAGIYPIVAGPGAHPGRGPRVPVPRGVGQWRLRPAGSDIENFVVQQVDAIVVLPLCGVDPLAPVLADAKAAGIKVVGYSTEIPGGDGAIVYQNVKGAEAVADEASRWYDENYTGDRRTSRGRCTPTTSAARRAPIAPTHPRRDRRGHRGRADRG